MEAAEAYEQWNWPQNKEAELIWRLAYHAIAASEVSGTGKEYALRDAIRSTFLAAYRLGYAAGVGTIAIECKQEGGTAAK